MLSEIEKIGTVASGRNSGEQIRNRIAISGLEEDQKIISELQYEWDARRKVARRL